MNWQIIKVGVHYVLFDKIHNKTNRRSCDKSRGHRRACDKSRDHRRSWTRTGRLTALEYPSLYLNHKGWVEPLFTALGPPVVCDVETIIT